MVARTRRHRTRQNRAFMIGAAVGLGMLSLFLYPASDRLHARGPMNSGHAELICPDCHKKAPGSARQQIQANIRFILGLRRHAADFGHRDVTNDTCLACHHRPNDRHPVYRFLEPRFRQVRQTLQPHVCLSCHKEHTGQRVTQPRLGFCVECHKDTRLRRDPLDVPHDRLIVLKLWDSCLGCHDFHGNHIMKTANTIEQIIPPQKIRAYFHGGPSPYGEARHYRAKREVNHE